MSAPIGRLQIKPSTTRTRRGSQAVRWSPAEPPTKAQSSTEENGAAESTHPPFYPFPLRANDNDER
jgi:hypothetical protein